MKWKIPMMKNCKKIQVTYIHFMMLLNYGKMN